MRNNHIHYDDDYDDDDQINFKNILWKIIHVKLGKNGPSVM